VVEVDEKRPLTDDARCDVGVDIDGTPDPPVVETGDIDMMVGSQSVQFCGFVPFAFWIADARTGTRAYHIPYLEA
jgi:hypothetical protein